jgi:hypothetical protein
MSYQDPIIGIPEMLDSLVANDRSRHEAARKLESALEARAIVLAYKNGHVFDDVDLAPVIDFIRDFPSGRISLQTEITAERLRDGGAGALRLQFELACNLVQATPIVPTTPRQTNEEAAKALIITWLKEKPGLTRLAVSAKAHVAIRDLKPKEFDRAWRDVPPGLKRGPGRPG